MEPPAKRKASRPTTEAQPTKKKGRGRLGRIWHSPKGGNIYLSLGFRPNIQAIHLRNFTLWQGLNICRFLRLFMETV